MVNSSTEKWKNVVVKGEQFGALLTGLSKAFNCLSHELLIAKLHAHGLELPALELIQSYLLDENNEPKSIRGKEIGRKFYLE